LIIKDNFPDVGAQAEALAQISRLQLDLVLGRRGARGNKAESQTIRKDRTGFDLSDSVIKADPPSGGSSVGNVCRHAAQLRLR
jgi:hypothetical protein